MRVGLRVLGFEVWEVQARGSDSQLLVTWMFAKQEVKVVRVSNEEKLLSVSSSSADTVDDLVHKDGSQLDESKHESIMMTDEKDALRGDAGSRRPSLVSNLASNWHHIRGQQSSTNFVRVDTSTSPPA